MSAATGRPVFLVTIDTEGDDLWSRPRVIETRNAAALPRFQELCERHGLRPTYLVNYEMARSPELQAFGRDVLRRGAGEIGMHLHAWYSPPDHALTADDHVHHPYLVEYPEPVMRAKIGYMTDLLEHTFGVKMLSHRAGRWALDRAYARALVDRGYRVDCSVTPHVSWRWRPGDPAGRGGADYSRFPADPYFVDLDDLGRPGDSPLLEVPMTIVPARPRALRWLRRALPSTPRVEAGLRRLAPVRWLRPDGTNLAQLLAIVEGAVAARRHCVEFMLHSSELMAGGSPTFPTAGAIERLYDDLEQLFARAARDFRGATLAEFYELERAREPARGGRAAA